MTLKMAFYFVSLSPHISADECIQKDRDKGYAHFASLPKRFGLVWNFGMANLFSDGKDKKITRNHLPRTITDILLRKICNKMNKT